MMVDKIRSYLFYKFLGWMVYLYPCQSEIKMGIGGGITVHYKKVTVSFVITKKEV